MSWQKSSDYDRQPVMYTSDYTSSKTVSETNATNIHWHGGTHSIS